MEKLIYDPVNRVWCRAIPAGWTFQEWREEEDNLVREMVSRSEAYQALLERVVLSKVNCPER